MSSRSWSCCSSWWSANAARLRDRSPLGRSVYWLTALVVVEAINPLQGGLRVGLGGLLLLLPPMLMFWVGRDLLSDPLLGRFLAIIASLAVASALYGLVQQLAGFPSWDQSWIARVARTDYIRLMSVA